MPRRKRRRANHTAQAPKLIKRTGPRRVLGSIEHVLLQLDVHQRAALRSRMRGAAKALTAAFKRFEQRLAWMERRIDKATRPKRTKAA